MRKIIFSTLTVLTFSFGFLAGCADDEEESFDNVAGCENYNDSIETAYTDCGVDYDEAWDVDCSIYADVNTCDIGDYWNCLADAYSCNTDTGMIEVGDTAACIDLAACG